MYDFKRFLIHRRDTLFCIRYANENKSLDVNFKMVIGVTLSEVFYAVF